MIRQIRRLSNLTLPNSPLLKNDSWAADYQSKNDSTCTDFSAASRFAKQVLAKQFDQAWRGIESQIGYDDLFLQSFRAEACSKFLCELPKGSRNAQFYWPQALKFSNAMKRAGIELSLQDYLSLIQLSFKAHDYQAVEEIWREIESYRPELLGSVLLWNQYIQASCQAYPLFWPLYAKSKNEHHSERLGDSDRPPLTGDLLEILRKMESVGTFPTARTYELILMAFARQGRLSACEQLLSHTWLRAPVPKWSVMHPELSTLTAIIESWGFNQKLPEGIKLMIKMLEAYKIPVDSPHAQSLWKRALRHAQVDLQPSGMNPKELFNDIWYLAKKYGMKPSVSMWSIRLEYLKTRVEFDKLVKVLPEIIATSQNPTNALHAKDLIETGLSQTVRYYTNKGRAIEALDLMDEWAAKGYDVRPRMENYIQRRTGMSSEQNKLNKDDDEDNDWF